MAFSEVTSIILKNKKPNPSLIPCSLHRFDALKISHLSIYLSIHLLIHFIRICECIWYHTLCVVDKVFRIKLNSSEKNFAVYIGTIFDLSIVEILFMSINLYM